MLMASKTIVVVDDSPTLLKLVQLVLGEMDLHVVTATNSAAALAAIAEAKPSLLLLDDVLEEETVEKLCQGIAATSPELPIVLLRSGRGPADPLKVPGVVDSITKPFSPDALKAVVSHIVGIDPPVASQSPRRLLSLTPPPEFVPEPPTEEDLAGSLAAFSAGEILGMMAEGQKTGTARFSHGRTAIGVCFSKGRVAFARAEGVAEEFLLGRFLVERDYLQAKDLEAATRSNATGKQAGPRLGQRLIAKGLIKERALHEAMRMQTSALVYELLRWDSGRFSFSPAAQAPGDEVDLGLVVDQLLMEGLRRVDEWRIIEREVHNFDEVFLREEERMAAMGPGKLLREEIAVAELLNGKNSVRDVVFQSHMGSFDVCRVIYRLRKSKLVRPRVSPSAPA